MTQKKGLRMKFKCKSNKQKELQKSWKRRSKTYTERRFKQQCCDCNPPYTFSRSHTAYAHIPASLSLKFTGVVVVVAFHGASCTSIARKVMTATKKKDLKFKIRGASLQRQYE
ncbi:hypothetical protein, unlikely [Trypanosoma brucei gambiense DAL972]|uniref:Uncharacterized protein n=1 Tax=Trypanosoma brucei gambiense (strain MHOM/CI/86/DAL972) TaxID=679716 RepID=C9ZKL5_TRYB9|nr:hypothetical protein, unlikely [Trypanosoma brucei gambiense DAL972]CBH10231.1 hypothetical protein, unlikely [Trypanosoma brucei gambiense DAL972]|eukprot:XP_011772521.1 hypothetical protein, unlikely [Trypanosoma brucei gambiense DAL972]